MSRINVPKRIFQKIGILLFMGIFAITCLTACGNSSEDIADSKSIQIESDIRTSATDTNGKLFFSVGETISFDGGIEITVQAVGRYNDYVYVELEIQNDSAAPFMIGEAMPLFFGNDYPLNNSSGAIEFGDGSVSGLPDEFVITQTVTVGRKAKGRFYAYCDNYSSLSNIEAEISNAVITIKDADTAGIADDGNFEGDLNTLEMYGSEQQEKKGLSGYDYEGEYVIAAQTNISGTVEHTYSQAFGDGYYIQLSGTNEFGEAYAISGIATESDRTVDGDIVYMMWDESCDNLQFLVTFHDTDYMDLQYEYAEIMDDREVQLGQTFSCTYYRMQ